MWAQGFVICIYGKYELFWSLNFYYNFYYEVHLLIIIYQLNLHFSESSFNIKDLFSLNLLQFPNKVIDKINIHLFSFQLITEKKNQNHNYPTKTSKIKLNNSILDWKKYGTVRPLYPSIIISTTCSILFEHTSSIN